MDKETKTVKVIFDPKNYGFIGVDMATGKDRTVVMKIPKGGKMKRHTLEVIVETHTDEGEAEGQRFLIPSGFDHLMIEVWESPTDLEVRYITKAGRFSLGKPEDAELQKLNRMVDIFAEKMKRELHVQFHKGKKGWKDTSHRSLCQRRLIVHAAEGRMVKAGSYAAIIWNMAREGQWKGQSERA